MPITIETLARALLPRASREGFFAPRERTTLLSAAEVLLDGVDFSLDDAVLVGNVERFVRGSRHAWRVRVLLTFVELAPLFEGRRRFSKLSRAARASFLRRHAFTVVGRVRPLVYLGAYASEIARRSVGFVPVLERPRFTTLRGRR